MTRYLITLVACALALVSLWPKPRVRVALPDLAPAWVDLDHVLGYAATTTFILALCPRAGVWAVAGPLLALGAVLEALQAFVPGRSVHVIDLASNALGIGLGASLAMLWRRWRTS